jgi:YHS domain-containing protein
MKRMSSFTTALHERLAAAAAAREAGRAAKLAQMEDRTRREAAFGPAAEEVHRTLVRPMVEEIVRAFDNCTVEHFKTPDGYISRCVLARTDRYPAVTELAIGLGPGPEATGGLLTYRLGIIPELMSFTKSDSWSFELAPLARDAIRDQLAEWLLRFTDTYLRLESEPSYQDWRSHLDPVCGMWVSGAAAHVLEHARRKIYFCSEDCRDRFQAQPGLYLSGTVPLS